MKTVALIAIAGMTSLLAPQAMAQTAFSFTGLNTGFVDGNSRMLGNRFSVTQSIEIAELGWFDWDSDGLGLAHEVGIWDTADQSLVASVVIPQGTGAELDNGFRYVALGSTVTLNPGVTYVLAGFDGANGDRHVWDNAIGGFSSHVTGFNVDPRVSLVDAIGSLTSGFAYPATTIGDARNTLMGPNFVIVPEPSATALLLSGCALLRVIGRKRG